MTTLCRQAWPIELVNALLVTTVASAMPLVGSVPAAADPGASDWARLRMCESQGRYDLDTRNGYYGAYQFSLRTWRGIGGAGYPHEASPAEQDYRALYLYRQRGWSPWPSCVRTLGLADDDDAHSMRVPSYEEAAYIGGARSPRHWPLVTPCAPGPQHLPQHVGPVGDQAVHPQVQ
jgi:hypothetical protein